MKSVRKSAGITVEGYLAGLTEPAQRTLREVHAVIRAASPKGATEVISYGMPAFALAVKNAKGDHSKPKAFFGFAAYKLHYSLFPFSGSFLEDFADELKAYAGTKGSFHLPYDQPIPKTLIRKPVKVRVAQMKTSL